jgi:hypothetical protein
MSFLCTLLFYFFKTPLEEKVTFDPTTYLLLAWLGVNTSNKGTLSPFRDILVSVSSIAFCFRGLSSIKRALIFHL